MSQQKDKFLPARGPEERLLAHEYTEGMMYFATDSGRIFLDSNGENKIPLGGGGVSIIYGYDPDVKANLASETFILHADKIDENSNPKVGDLIINSDGKFYKI
jgi:hypothetical protein